MDETKKLLGKILGEIYRLQKESIKDDYLEKNNAVIFGLLNGMEPVIDDELEKIGEVSQEGMEKALDILAKYDVSDEEIIDPYQIESELEDNGISLDNTSVIIRYLYLKHDFSRLFDKLKKQDREGTFRLTSAFASALSDTENY